MRIDKTKDGSVTLYSEEFDEHYHSVNGAYTESEHIFVNLGFNTVDKKNISILEIGYGTGLNAMLTYVENLNRHKLVFYLGIDMRPTNTDLFSELLYAESYGIEKEKSLKFCENWNEIILISEMFQLHKENVDFYDFNPNVFYDLIYFDAFSSESQPDMWSFDNLKKIIDSLTVGGVFVTYSSKGVLKQNLRELGMEVKRFPGPPGKRHVVRAIKK